VKISGEVVENVVGCLAPDERAGVVVPVFDPIVDIASELSDVVVGGAPKFLGGQFGEPAFDLLSHEL
jgi:hypothetical protein